MVTFLGELFHSDWVDATYMHRLDSWRVEFCIKKISSSAVLTLSSISASPVFLNCLHCWNHSTPTFLPSALRHLLCVRPSFPPLCPYFSVLCPFLSFSLLPLLSFAPTFLSCPPFPRYLSFSRFCPVLCSTLHPPFFLFIFPPPPLPSPRFTLSCFSFLLYCYCFSPSFSPHYPSAAFSPQKLSFSPLSFFFSRPGQHRPWDRIHIFILAISFFFGHINTPTTPPPPSLLTLRIVLYKNDIRYVIFVLW